MGRRNRTCYLCGETYEYCPTCLQDKTKPAWMSEFHSENCVKIFGICTRFNMKSLSKEEAKSELSVCDLSGRDKFINCVKRDLDVIFAPNPKSKKTYKKLEPVVEEPVVMPEFVLETAVVELPDVQTEQLEEVAMPTVAQVETETVETVHEVVLKEEK